MAPPKKGAADRMGLTAPKVRRPRSDVTKAKMAFLERLRGGSSVVDALAAAGRSQSTYREWRRDPKFVAEVDEAKIAGRAVVSSIVPSATIGFEEFCREYLDQPLFAHQLQWLDLLEGRQPRGLHPSQTYEPGDPSYIIVNTPPEHAKSTTLSINYVTYRVCMDPNIRIMLVSKTADRAKEFLYAVKSRLSHPRYKRLQDTFGPPGGFQADADVWASDRIYLGSGNRDSGEKDPTIQALGIGGLIYGARSDLIIIDDGVVLSNAHQFEQQIRWIQQEVITRPGPNGKILVVGTRVDAMDLYRALREPDRYPSGISPWTYLTQPAVLQYAEDKTDWVTLWPRADRPWSPAETPGNDGLYPRWDGQHMCRRRGMLNPRTWALAYMQAEVEEDSVFNAVDVRGCVNGARQPGVMSPGMPSIRKNGMRGLYIVGSMDPAMVGDTGVIIYGVDRFDKKRYVVDVKVRGAATPAWIRQTIKDLTELYGVNEWRIEKNAFQQFLTQDPELKMYLGQLGVRLAEHHTGRNKWDSGFGVAAMATLFELRLIELPSTAQSEAVKQLVEQLITWSPETKSKTDLVMALWFAEIRAREIVRSASDPDGPAKSHLDNRFLSRRRRQDRTVVNLNDLAAVKFGSLNAVG